MKYYKTSKFTKAIGSTGFVTLIACALIAVGAIGWFVFSNNESVVETPSDNPSQSYPDTDSSYNSEVEIPDINEQPATDANQSITDIPFEEEQPQEKTQDKITYVLPIAGNILKGYSDTALQYSATYGDMRLHTGVDILCDIGSNINSAGNGTVKSIVEDANFGRVITIEHEGKITVKYCGMGGIYVKEGDTVAAGDVIGTLGETPCECADNPHFHIEAYIDGKSVSPLQALGFE